MIMPNILEFCPGQSAERAHRSLRARRRNDAENL